MKAARRMCVVFFVLALFAAGFLPLTAANPAVAEGEEGGDTIVTDAPAPTPDEQITQTPLSTVSPSDTPTPAVTLTPTPMPTSTPTPTLASTPTPVQTNTPSPTPTPTQTPTPTPIPFFVTIIARDTTMEQWSLYNDQGTLSPNDIASESTIINLLLGYASAYDENNRQVAVTVDDFDEFSPYIPGVYRIIYKAVHPVSREAHYASAMISVTAIEEEERIEEEEEEVVPFVKDETSNARYKKYLSYRNSIQKKLAKVMEQLDEDFSDRVDMIKGAFPGVTSIRFARRVSVDQDEGDEESITELVYIDEPDIRNWSQVLPVFVANSSMKVKKPLDLYNLRNLPLEPIKNVFWDMHEWSYIREGDELTLVLRELDYEEMIVRLGLDEKTVNKLEELMQPEFQMLFAALTRDDTFIDLSESDIRSIRNSLPPGTTMQREQVVLTAHTLTGRIKYFWGGKYSSVGWNPLWGVDRVVESENSETTGTLRPYGMDCSGFVAWVFVNAAKDEKVAEAIGTGTSIQWSKSRPLGWDEAIPGDIAFFTRPGKKNHVGIVVEKRNDGTYLIAHCSSAQNTVVISEAWETGFRYMRRPALYEDA